MESVLSETEGRWLTRREIPVLVCPYANEDAKSQSLMYSKGIFLIGLSRAVLIGQRCTVLIGRGKSQSYWLKQDSRNSFIRAGSDGRNTGQAGSLAQRQAV